MEWILSFKKIYGTRYCGGHRSSNGWIETFRDFSQIDEIKTNISEIKLISYQDAVEMLQIVERFVFSNTYQGEFERDADEEIFEKFIPGCVDELNDILKPKYGISIRSSDNYNPSCSYNFIDILNNYIGATHSIIKSVQQSWETHKYHLSQVIERKQIELQNTIKDKLSEITPEARYLFFADKYYDFVKKLPVQFDVNQPIVSFSKLDFLCASPKFSPTVNLSYATVASISLSKIFPLDVAFFAKDAVLVHQLLVQGAVECSKIPLNWYGEVFPKLSILKFIGIKYGHILPAESMEEIPVLVTQDEIDFALDSIYDLREEGLLDVEDYNRNQIVNDIVFTASELLHIRIAFSVIFFRFFWNPPFPADYGNFTRQQLDEMYNEAFPKTHSFERLFFNKLGHSSSE